MTGKHARLIGVNHVALEVDDLDEALAFYRRLFAFELRGRHGTQMAFIDAGDQFIALSAPRRQPRKGGSLLTIGFNRAIPSADLTKLLV